MYHSIQAQLLMLTFGLINLMYSNVPLAQGYPYRTNMKQEYYYDLLNDIQNLHNAATFPCSAAVSLNVNNMYHND